METQTRFDLDAAIVTWQQELAAQTGMTSVVRRELEAHLRDTISELQTRGLNNEEAFWLARRRTGAAQQLGEEFVKADPANAWRERTFWIAAALIVMNLWSSFLDQFWSFNPVFMRNSVGDILPGWIVIYLPGWLGNFRASDAQQILMLVGRFAPIVALVFFVAKGRLKYANGALSWMLTSRSRFFMATSASFLFVHLFDFYSGGPGRIAAVFVYQFPWTFSLVALATWLIPAKSSPMAVIA